MIKKLLLVAFMVLPMFAFSQDLKIGIVSLEEIIEKLPEYQDAQAKFVETSKRYEDELAKLNDELKRRYDDIQAMPDDELPAIKERKMREFQEYQVKIQQFTQTADQDLAKVQQDLMAPLEKKVRDAIESVGSEGGFSLIEQKVSQLILYYAAPVVDITEQVKTKLGVQ